jgi:hypothetical protein
MAHIYQQARITLVSGSMSASQDIGLVNPKESYLFHSDLDFDFGSQQKIETIQGRQYITSLPRLSDQILEGEWRR